MSTDQSIPARTSPSGSRLVGRGDVDLATAVTRSLLGYGVLAGAVYLVVGVAQALVRDGFDPTRHGLSQLALGPWGWIQIANLVVSGLMVIAAAVGMRRALRVLGGGPGSVWGPRLVAVYGLGLIGSGVFVADPMNGYPPGTPDGATAVSASGLGHLVAGAVGFVCLVVAMGLLARHYAGHRRPIMAWASGLAGAVFLTTFLAIASGVASPVVVLGFYGGVIVAWSWLAVVSVDLYRRVS